MHKNGKINQLIVGIVCLTLIMSSVSFYVINCKSMCCANIVNLSLNQSLLLTFIKEAAIII